MGEYNEGGTLIHSPKLRTIWVNEGRPPKRKAEVQTFGKKPRERPTGSWKDGMRKDQEKTGINWELLPQEQNWRDRISWRDTAGG